MNITGIFRVFVFFGLTGNFVHSTKWVNNLLKYIVRDSGARQVTFITKLAENENIASPIIEELFVKLTQRIPVVRINITGHVDEPKISTPDTSATFFLLAHETLDDSQTPQSNGLIDAVAEMSSSHYRPKYLIVFVTRLLSNDLEELLQYAWNKKLLDLAILEWAEPEGLKNLRSVNYSFGPPIVHRFDPFQKKYERIGWTSDIDLFPNKVRNMAGHPLTIRALDYPPFTIAEFNEFQEPVHVGGANIRLIQAIAQRFNASLKYIPSPLRLKGSENISDPVSFAHNAEETQKMDLKSILDPYDAKSKGASLRTAPIDYDEFCAVVPILLRVNTPVSKNVFKAYILSFGIVVIFCIVRRVLRFEAAMWRMFYIGRLLFGVSVTRQPTGNVERVIFTCLVAISAIYSSTIYTAITEISVQRTSEITFESYEYLDNSGLTPIISPFYFNKTFDNATGALDNLKNKSIRSLENKMTCAQRAAQQKNITCLMFRQEAELAIARNKRGGRDTIKIAKPCFWSDSRAFPLGKAGSPYRSNIDDFILQMHSAGLIKKFYEDDKIASSKVNDDVDEWLLERKQNMITLRKQLLAIVIVGYTLSMLVFIAEIVVHRISKYRKRKIRPVVRFQYIE